MWTRQVLAEHCAALGLERGDSVLAHAGLRSVGPILGGPDALIAAIGDVIGRDGTLLAYCDWAYDDRDYPDRSLRAHVPPFDPAASRATRDNGAFPELLRTTPGARRSDNPGASMTALGGRAVWFTADHALDYGYGPQSPLGKLVAANGKTTLIGAPLDTMTLLHHAEHLADFPNKRIRRYESPLLINGETVWRQFEEFDTSHSPDGLPEDYFVEIVESFLATGNGKRGTIGAASSVLVPAPAIVAFAVNWLETRLRSTP
ncbi:aminoglycoside 3-N-acetyltransferase [Devosia sp. UYZn731]|uniref:aminoglycoside 3-N-acetyltransferase n=1 Tax=Devosia sp. UYZn731 TaxID=3156345 RepID=UPI003396F6CD